MKASYGSQSEEEGLAFVPPTPRTAASRRSSKRVMVGASLALFGAAAATGALMAFVNPDDLSTVDVAPMELHGAALVESLAAEIGIDDDATFESLDNNSDGVLTKDEYLARLTSRRDEVLGKLTQSNLADDAKGPIATLIQENFDSEAACIGDVFNVSGGRAVDKTTFEFVHPVITSLCRKSLSLDSSALKKAVDGATPPADVDIDGDITTPATEGPPISIDGQPTTDTTIDGDMPLPAPTLIPNGDITVTHSTESDEDDNEDTTTSPTTDESSGEAESSTDTTTPASNAETDEGSTSDDAESPKQDNLTNDVAGNDEDDEEDTTPSTSVPGDDDGITTTPATESPVSGGDTDEKDSGDDDETTPEDNTTPSPTVTTEDDVDEDSTTDDDSSATTAPSTDATETPTTSDTEDSEASSESDLPPSEAPSPRDDSSEQGDLDTQSPLSASENGGDTPSPPGDDVSEDDEEPATNSPGVVPDIEIPDTSAPDIDVNDSGEPETNSPGVVVDDEPETNTEDDEPGTNSPGVVVDEEPETNSPGVVVNEGPETNSPGVAVMTNSPETNSPGVSTDDSATESPWFGGDTTITPSTSASTATDSFPSTPEGTPVPAVADDFFPGLLPSGNVTGASGEENKSAERIAFENALTALFEKELSDREQRLAYANLQVEKNSFMLDLIHKCISNAGRQFEFDSSFSQDKAVEWIRTQCLAFPDVFHHREH